MKTENDDHRDGAPRYKMLQIAQDIGERTLSSAMTVMRAQPNDTLMWSDGDHHCAGSFVPSASHFIVHIWDMPREEVQSASECKYYFAIRDSAAGWINKYSLEPEEGAATAAGFYSRVIPLLMFNGVSEVVATKTSFVAWLAAVREYRLRGRSAIV